MDDIVNYLRIELAKRRGPWETKDEKGNLIWKEPLYTPILLMPLDVMAILNVIDEGRGLSIAECSTEKGST